MVMRPRPNRPTNLAPPLCLGALLLSSGCGGDISSAQGLTQALASARPGDIIQLGAVTIEGGFDVPPGVTLQGRGPGDTTVVGPCNRPAVSLMAQDAITTSVRDLSIALVMAEEGHVPVGILARGARSAEIKAVNIRADFGFAIAAEGLGALRIEDVALSGPVTPQIGMGLQNVPAPHELATHGLTLVDVNSASLARVDIENFGIHGALFVSSDTTWTDGAIRGGFNDGLAVESGQLNLQGVRISSTQDGAGLRPAVGALFLNADTQSDSFTVEQVDGFGIFQEQGDGRHLNLSAQQNRDAGLIGSRPALLEVSGELAGNGFAGMVAVAAADLRLHDAIIRDTVERPVALDVTGIVRAGDGVQLVGAQTASLDNVSLLQNERAGLILDLNGGDTANISLNAVSVTVTSTTQGGAIAQDGTVLPGWDNGVTRMGTNATNDGQLAGLPVAESFGPGDQPFVTALGGQGLSTLIGY